MLKKRHRRFTDECIKRASRANASTTRLRRTGLWLNSSCCRRRTRGSLNYSAFVIRCTPFTSSILLTAMARVPERSKTCPVTRTYLPRNGISRLR